MGGEIVHLVVEQKAGALDRDARAVTALQGIGVADGQAVAVDDAEMRGAVSLVADGNVLRQVFAPRGLLRIDAVGQLLRVFLAGQVVRDLDEVWIAEQEAWGGVELIAIGPDGRLLGVNDPRRPAGSAAGF